MDEERARQRLLAEQAEVERLLASTRAEVAQDQQSAAQAGDISDPAQALVDEGVSDAVAASLRGRLDAIRRALARLDDGTYGRSVRSGAPIPDERLEADPAAELTVDEARGQ
jgi:DnaK suppressor protein